MAAATAEVVVVLVVVVVHLLRNDVYKKEGLL